jgi:uncharacterized membrane protein
MPPASREKPDETSTQTARSGTMKALPRLDFVDTHRGLAVLLMLWMHTADGWLRPELKQGPAWDAIRTVGGLAAPTFLLLAGLGLALGWSRAGAAPTPGQVAAAQRAELARGLQLVVLGYALRVQMWMLDADGYRLVEGWAAALPLAVAFVTAYLALDAWARGLRAAPWFGMVAALSALTGYGLVAAFIPERFGPLLRVDVLQAIGASLIVLVALRRPLQRRAELGLVLAVVVALLTPGLRGWLPGPLPTALAGYVAQWDIPQGQPWPTLFPLFPWISYALVGACIGLHLGRAQLRHGGGARFALMLAAGSVLLILVACEPLPTARFLRMHWPWLTPLLRVAYRVGVALLLGGLAVLLAHPRLPLRGVPIALGRASLVIYWIHLQFAFGASAKPIVRALDFQAWAIGLAMLTMAMSALAILWVRLRASLHRAASRQGTRAVGADPAALTGA